MELFAKTLNGWKPLNVFIKISILAACQGFEYASGPDIIPYSVHLQEHANQIHSYIPE